MSTSTASGPAVVSAAEAAELEMARLRKEVADLQASRQVLEREKEELRKASQGESASFVVPLSSWSFVKLM